MPEGRHKSSRRLTFGQAEGLEAIPSQLRKDEVSKRLRIKLWMVFEGLIDHHCEMYDLGRYFVTDKVIHPLIEYEINVKELFVENYPTNDYDIKGIVRSIFSDENYIGLFNFVQHMLYEYEGDYELSVRTDAVLRECLSPYRVVDTNTLFAVGSEDDVQNINRAIDSSSSYKAYGARSHIRKAIGSLNNGLYSDSVRESISAVESLAKVLSGNPKSELAEALVKLEKSANIHGGMKKAFTALYGYASDEKGIRHSLLFKEKANVDEADALFMIGACSSFVTYLISRAADAGISVTSNE